MQQIEKRPIPPTGILQEWVAKLGLRHQGVLLTVVRGCDTAPKEDASKAITRCLRAAILNTHCADPSQAKSFIEFVDDSELKNRFKAFRKNCDHYPHHFVMHVLHAVQIIGYCHPDTYVRVIYLGLYFNLCKGLHVTPETNQEMNQRLNAEETSFRASQQ